jgi:hypothetical protein
MAKNKKIGFGWFLWLLWQRHFKVFAWMIFLAILFFGSLALFLNPALQFYILLVLLFTGPAFFWQIEEYDNLK